MGLLDDLLGQLAGGQSQRGAETPPSGEAGMGKVMAALLPVVLAMMANRQGAPASSRAGTGGGLGDVLGQVLGGSSGGSGLGGLLEQFQRAGFGHQARSWVGTGQNEPLPPDALEQVFGRGGLAEIARRAGVSERDASQGLSRLMPEVVDRVTPDGQVPDGTALLASVESLSKRLDV
jgi:uncharacterized protein YidB (DUF937 family)